MQVIAEACPPGPGRDAGRLPTFRRLERGRAHPHEVTVEVLRQVDAETGRPLVDLVVDAASGKWTGADALDLAVPVHIGEATFARRILRAGPARAAGRTLAGNASALMSESDEARAALHRGRAPERSSRL